MERRYSDRVPTEVGVSCRVPASPEKAVLIDLSRSGCRLEFSHRRVDQGATVNLDFQLGQPIGGQVVWTEGAFAGVRFHTALPNPWPSNSASNPVPSRQEGLIPPIQRPKRKLLPRACCVIGSAG